MPTAQRMLHGQSPCDAPLRCLAELLKHPEWLQAAKQQKNEQREAKGFGSTKAMQKSRNAFSVCPHLAWYLLLAVQTEELKDVDLAIGARRPPPLTSCLQFCDDMRQCHLDLMAHHSSIDSTCL